MFKPTPEQARAAMQAAAVIYRRRFREQQYRRYWHIKRAPAVSEPPLARRAMLFPFFYPGRRLPRKKRRLE